MFDINAPFVTDTPLSTRWPVHTRGNVGEINPEATLPLSFSLLSGASERLWRAALVEFGAFDTDEFAEGIIETLPTIHGYLYINLSAQRTFGVRMPGATPELMDQLYLGDYEAPPYVPHPNDAKPEYTERILASVQRVLSESHRNDIMVDDKKRAKEVRAARPDYSAMSDLELLEYAKRIMKDECARVTQKQLLTVYEVSIVAGALQQLAVTLEDPSLTIRLTTGFGNIASAAPNTAMWDLAQVVKASPTLTSIFDTGVRDLASRLRESSDPDAKKFTELFDRFLFSFGSRSTGEWSITAKTWEAHPAIPLGMIDRLRFQGPEKQPQKQEERLRAEREALTRSLREALAGDSEKLDALESVVNAVAIYMPAREQAKANVVRILQEARLPVMEIARRHVESGHLAKPEQLAMLLVDELKDFIVDPNEWLPVIESRGEWYDELQKYEPPFTVTTGQVPPVSQWVLRQEPNTPVAVTGEVLTGLAACHGVAEGVARIITDPEDAPDLNPGEILVAPITDPGWTPIFTSAEAVVVNVGAALSHAAIVSRELGIPCVLAVKDATRRIADGAKIRVDGTNGTVTVL